MFASNGKKRFFSKKIIVACVCFFGVALSVGAVVSNQSAETVATDSQQTNSTERGDRQLVASSSEIAMYYTGDTQLLEVEYKESGYVWKSAVNSALYKDLELSEAWKENLSALFQFTYYNSKKSDKANTLSSNSLSNGVKVTPTPLENGLSLKFNFTELGIIMKIEINLDGDTVKLTMPEDSIKETKEYKVVSVSPLPFFGAAANGEQGYLVYPDGSGAIHYFNEKETRDARPLKLDIYGSRTWEESTMNDLETSVLASAKLPIFGVCKNGNTFVAIVDDKAIESTIEVSQSGVSVPFERIANVFTFRRTYTVIKPDVKSGESSVVKIESTMLPGERSVTYAFLPTDSGYSGMANRYREYLLKNGGINKLITEGDDVPLMLDLFMGISKEQMLMDKYTAMTDFDKAQRILSDLLSSGVTDIRANLIGWQKDGFGNYPDSFAAESKLGGNKGLKSLNEWAVSAGIKLTLQNNYMLAKADSGINKKNNCVYTKGSLLLTDSKEKLLLLSPMKAHGFFKNDLSKAKQLSVRGINFDGIGEYIYPDYNGNNTVTRAEVQKIWADMLKSAREETGYVSIIGGNTCSLKNVDFLHSVTVHDSGYFMSDETIPLYQMVIHGYIPYAAEEPGNLFYDSKIQSLQMLEYGTVPYFQLTWNSSSELVDTDYNFLFTSRFEQWKDDLLASVKDYNDNYKALYSSAMVEHKRLSDKVVRVTYENGMRLYVNYGENVAEADHLTIKALDALVVSP